MVAQESYVYFEHGVNTVMVKIGRTTRGVDLRIKEQKKGHPNPIQLVFSSGRLTEADLVKRFGEHRLVKSGNSKWFKLPLEELLALGEEADEADEADEETDEMETDDEVEEETEEADENKQPKPSKAKTTKELFEEFLETVPDDQRISRSAVIRGFKTFLGSRVVSDSYVNNLMRTNFNRVH